MYEKHDVLKKVVHPNFDSRTFNNDFMLVILDGRSQMNPICLANERTVLDGGQKLHVLGFGLTELGELSESLLETDMNYMNNTSCNDVYKSLNEITNNMLCTDTSDEGKDACKGDSGGPLIVQGRNNMEDVLVGVVSWGAGCAKYPGVYSRITSVIEWIENTAKDFGGTLPSCKFGNHQISSLPIYSPIQLATSKPSIVPAIWPYEEKTKARKCKDETDFIGALYVQRDIVDGCEWVEKNTHDRCGLLNDNSGRKFRDHCPKTCNYCRKVVMDNINYGDNFCSSANFRRNKWKFCQRIQVRGNCPVSCSCVPLNARGSTCRDTYSTCQHSKCRSYNSLRQCAKECRVCGILEKKTCPIEDSVAVYAKNVRINCNEIPANTIAFQRRICNNIVVRARCPNACAIRNV